MKIDTNDPRLTAYALGELEGPDRAVIEKELIHRFDLCQEVAEIRRTAEGLTKELQAEPVSELPAAKRAAIAARRGPSAGPAPLTRAAQAAPGRPRFRIPFWIPLTAAALLVMGFLVVAVVSTQNRGAPGPAAAPAPPQLAHYQEMYGQVRSPSPPPMGAQPAMSPGELKFRSYAGYAHEGRDTDYSGGTYLEGEPWRGRREPWNTESYDQLTDNPFLPAAREPLSTFSIDVDTASYSMVRRFLQQGQLPPKGAVRIEELINYFHYDYPSPPPGQPFSVTLDAAGCPWSRGHRLVRIAIKGREIPQDKRPPSNLVFLLDVSGSMDQANKLPLVRESMKMLAERLTENDRVAIVVYAGSSGLVLPSTTGDQKAKILTALDGLRAGGSTNGAGGIVQAYEVAAANFIQGGTNRVLLCTDGDFNVGVTNQSDLIELIEKKAKGGVFLSVLGFGMGNYKDSTLEKLADKGNGHYAYIDTEQEARKVFVEQMSGTLVTIAKDVKIQVEFNPAQVQAYRLLGYENRILRAEDFNDDRKDAGDIGAGHTVTALYEVVPPGAEIDLPSVDPLKYQPAGGEGNRRPSPKAAEPDEKPTPAAEWSGELLTLKLRYKEPDGQKSRLLSQSLTDGGMRFDKSPADFQFAAAVAAFGMILRGSPYRGSYTLAGVEELAASTKGKDKEGSRAESLELVAKARKIAPPATPRGDSPPQTDEYR